MSPEDLIVAEVEVALARTPGRLLVAGICGAQGSGKSTLATKVAARIEGTAILSLDDLYRTRADRERLARDVHPLLRTRGVPGTHDVDLGLRVLDSLDRRVAVALPRFDKANDDRLPEASWPLAPANTRVLLFEGWCVGAQPQPAAALKQPINALERNQDVDGTWRRHVNESLGGVYQTLFGRLDLLIQLAAPSWDVVLSWRVEQEHALVRNTLHARAAMSDAQVAIFISHYERLTRHMLAEMPDRSDLTFFLDIQRRASSVKHRRVK